jgi:carbamoyl-phosphate synthase large subunit
MKRLHIPILQSGMAGNLQQALVIASKIGYPLMAHPSYVLGVRGIEVIQDEQCCKSMF